MSSSYTSKINSDGGLFLDFWRNYNAFAEEGSVGVAQRCLHPGALGAESSVSCRTLKLSFYKRDLIGRTV